MKSGPNQTQEKKSESLASYMLNSVGWFNPVPSLSLSKSKKLLSLSLLSLIQPAAGGSVCFVSSDAPGGFGFYKLACANGQENSLLGSLMQNCSVSGTSCGLSFLFSSANQFGKSAFGYTICTMASLMPADPCTVQILDMKVLNGYVPSLDNGPVTGVVMGAVALVGVVGAVAYCRFFRKPQEVVEAADEKTVLVQKPRQ